MESSSSDAAPASTAVENGGECDPSPSFSPASSGAAATEVAAPPPPRPASAKRRWSPCTWRYAIEESQPELPSRSRSSVAAASSAPAEALSSLHSRGISNPSFQHQNQQQHHSKSKVPPSQNNLSQLKAADNSHRSSSHPPSRGHSSENRTRSHSRTPPRNRVADPSKRISQHDLTSGRGRSPEKRGDYEEEENAVLHGIDRNGNGGCGADEKHDNGDEDESCANSTGDNSGYVSKVTRYDEEYFKRRRREMSPSELYFCRVCSMSKGKL
ncbi:hypothetical protein KP509_28G013400 [Ceratopteris richardii]|uniref:Uncharacterized protein n=1 Tax=Ceratopteris richardii TaxID=49495 RepID=A0A8T2RC76_CERRI|nr:hypothetical protein KP509_28G013400 [Ceratopteris richardii]